MFDYYYNKDSYLTTRLKHTHYRVFGIESVLLVPHEFLVLFGIDLCFVFDQVVKTFVETFQICLTN